MPLRGASGPGETARATTVGAVDALDREARHAVADHDLRALGDQRGELVELDDHAGRRACRASRT